VALADTLVPVALVAVTLVLVALAVPVVVTLARVDLVVECPEREGPEAAIRVVVPAGSVAA
jgi:hypothetical protein